MSKVHSSWLLASAAVLSTVHAPTFEIGRTRCNANEPTLALQGQPSIEAAAFNLQVSLPREYAEEDDLKRFGLDEFHLPSLDVTLPALFEWSDADRTYLVDHNTSPFLVEPRYSQRQC